MKKILSLILALSVVKLIIHFIGNQNYGFHRDELLHLSVSEHLDWGYFEFPPFIALAGKLSHFLFGYSLFGMRLFPTLAGITILILTCLIAIEIGGRKKAVLLSGVLILVFIPFYRNHLLFQPVAFDQLFWTLSFYYLVRFLKTEAHKYLLLLGISLAIGFLNKYTIVILIVAILIGLLVTQKGKIIKNKWLYSTGFISFCMVLPNLIWQMQHHFPVLKHFQKLNEKQLDEIGTFDFILDQLHSPFTFIIAIIGLITIFFDVEIKKYKAIGITFLVVFFAMWILKSKTYYFYAIYPVVFAFGAYKVEKMLLTKNVVFYSLVSFLVLISVYFIPEAIPVLPIEKYVDFKKIKPNSEGRYILTGDYADMFGWEEQVKIIDSVYQTLSDKEKKECIILAENYGEAGALTVLGEKYNLPKPVCSHGSFWLWGTGTTSGEITITLGIEKEIIEKVFEEYQLIKIIHHKYAIEEENNIPIYLCKKTKIKLKKIWPSFESHVFD
ncbi:glycosyltransferase family 39 protein [Flavobacterium jejuense]|uniref:Glycosyltransferase family 39 protein n=1 Tax=Flavobacterium jejuense TaxID=1544455 RepID=A0ABX0INM7_9FLAO|nr:glycosyltransferase family 39 protein [Flavobacterium jejuense]NHN24394.1 glycosyltransferase family 39 protein [Flavobacterium jejuense]